MLKKFLIFLSFSLLAACGHEPVGRDFAFDDSKDYGLLAYDLYFVGEAWPNFTFYLFPYDEATGDIDYRDRTEMGCGYVCERGNEGVRFFLGAMDPGTYVVGYLHYQVEFKRTLLCFSDQTLEVTIEPGTVKYLGEIILPVLENRGLMNDKLAVLEHDVDHLRTRLQKFPNILEIDKMYRPNGTLRAVRREASPGKLAIQPVTYVSFNLPEVQREGACIWDYVN